MRLNSINPYIREFVIPLFIKLMKHYRIVKKSTHFLIAISAFAIIFNITIFTAMTFGLMSVSKPVQTIASETCSSGTNVKIELTDTTVTNKQINQDFGVMIFSNEVAPSTGRHYQYQFFVKDVATGYVADKTDVMGSYLGAAMSEDFADLQITEIGGKEVYALYSQGLTPESTATDPHCLDWLKTNVITITGVNRATDSPNITITVPEKVDQGASTTIKSTITGATAKLYDILISKGGDCPNTPMTDAHCWNKFGGKAVPSSPYEFDTVWPTTIPGTDIGRHGIGIIVWPATGGDRNSPSDSKTVYMTICEPGTSGTTCVSASGPTDPGAGGPEENIETPDKIEKFSSFATDFFLPIKKITGAGDITIVILYVMGYLIGAFAFLGIIVSGIQYISSGGDSSKSEKAKKNLIYCVIGITIAILAFSIQAIVATFWK